jgi:hypothetical protein
MHAAGSVTIFRKQLLFSKLALQCSFNTLNILANSDTHNSTSPEVVTITRFTLQPLVMNCDSACVPMAFHV